VTNKFPSVLNTLMIIPSRYRGIIIAESLLSRYHYVELSRSRAADNIVSVRRRPSVSHVAGRFGSVFASEIRLNS